MGCRLSGRQPFLLGLSGSGGLARYRSHPLGVLPGLSLPVFLARMASKTPYGRARPA